MVGFALAHNTRAMVPLVLSVVLVLLWVPSAIVWLALRAAKGERPSAAEWIEVALGAGALVILHLVPSNT